MGRRRSQREKGTKARRSDVQSKLERGRWESFAIGYFTTAKTAAQDNSHGREVEKEGDIEGSSEGLR